jgi:TolA-binding protein
MKSTQATGTLFSGMDLTKRLIITAVVGTVAALFGVFATFMEHAIKKPSPSFDEEMSQLTQTEGNLRSLIAFVERQKKQLRDSEQVLAELRSQQEQLKPVVEADKQIVDAIFSLQAQQQRATVWWDRGIGFVSGVASSIVAMLLAGAYQKARRQRRVKTLEATL